MMRGRNSHIDNFENNEHNRSKFRLDFVVQHIDAAILMETLDGKIELVNDSFCELFKLNYRSQDLRGKNIDEFQQELSLHFISPNNYLEKVKNIISQARTQLGEEIELADGRIFKYDYRPAQLDDQSEVTGHLWLFKDISEFKGLEKKNNIQEQFFQKVLNNLPADIALFDKQQKYLFVNQLGYPRGPLRDWLIGKDDFDYFLLQNKGLDRAVARKKYFDQAINYQKVVQFEEKDINAEGQEVNILRHYYPYIDDRNEVEFIVGYGVDISRIKQDEKTLIQNIETYQNLIHNLDEVVFIVEANGMLKYVNPLWQQVFNKSYIESVGKPLNTFFSDSIFEKLSFDINQILSDFTLDKVKNEIQIEDLQGVLKYYRYYLSRFRGLKNDELMVSGFLVDITDQVNAREELMKVLQKERELSDMKTVFVNMVSHELRTPLTIIQSSAEIIELLQQQPDTSKEILAGYATKIVNEVSGLKTLMDELLLISRLESDKVKFSGSDLNIKSFIEEIIQDRYAPWKDGRTVKLEVLGKQRDVVADPLMLRHIVCNILDNALIYSSGKQAPELSLFLGNNHWSISCKDYGIGIPEHDLKEIGTSFKRGSNASYIPGTGLGLVVVKYLTEKHLGTIHYQSKVGEGTKVRVSFHYPENK